MSSTGAGGRLSLTAQRFVELNGSPITRRHAPAELIAAAIRRDAGNVWPAVAAFDVSYRHATRIRAGWRPGGERADPIRHRSELPAIARARRRRRRGIRWAAIT
jgi:hypothetical protein